LAKGDGNGAAKLEKENSDSVSGWDVFGSDEIY
jgi:hypothetical protein